MSTVRRGLPFFFRAVTIRWHQVTGSPTGTASRILHVRPVLILSLAACRLIVTAVYRKKGYGTICRKTICRKLTRGQFAE